MERASAQAATFLRCTRSQDGICTHQRKSASTPSRLNRAPDKRYRTSPLNGLWTHTQGGFYHDGRFATLLDVVNHYDNCLGLGLSRADKSDLVEFLKALPQENESEKSGDASTD
jgi:cytochrome c peroxidase